MLRTASLVLALLVLIPIAVTAMGIGGYVNVVAENGSHVSHVAAKEVSAADIFVKSVCLKISVLGRAVEHSNATKLVKEAAERALSLCRKAYRARGREAVKLALAACRAFAPAAIYVAKHVEENGSVKQAIASMIEKAISVRLAAIDKMEELLNRVPKTNVTNAVLSSIDKTLSEARNELEKARTYAAHGEVMKAEKLVASATAKIVEAARTLHHLVMRGLVLSKVLMHGIALTSRVVTIAVRALKTFENTSDTKALVVALKALSFALRYPLKRLETAVNILGLSNATALIRELETNVSRARELVIEALNASRNGDLDRAKSYATQAIAQLSIFVELRSVGKTVAHSVREGVEKLVALRRSVARCVIDELSTLVIAKEALRWLAMHSRNPATKLEAELVITMINEYMHHLIGAAHPFPAHHPCHHHAHHPRFGSPRS